MKNQLAALLLVLFSQSVFSVPIQGHKILISAANPLAVEAGQRAFEMGGNAVDAAVAVGLTLSVTSPYFGSLGGGGFAMVRMKDKVEALDFRELAPQSAHPKYYLNLPKTASQIGGHAVGVPGVPAGLVALHEKYGKLRWNQLFTVPIELANKGFRISGEWVRKTGDEKENFDAGSKSYFLKNGKEMFKPGELLKQPQLAKALVHLRDRKAVGFYSGPVATDLVDSVRANGGTMTLDDLKKYKVRWLQPISINYRGYRLSLMPPPSSGGVVIAAALAMLEKAKVQETEELSAEEFHLLAEIESRAFRGRSLLGDPDFTKNPVEWLLSDSYLGEMLKSLSPKKSVALKPLGDANNREAVETTHYSVLAADGTAVAITTTLNGDYGSGVTSRVYGIALNNEMDDFTTRPGEPNMYGLIQGQANSVEPLKRPLSSMSPTIVEKDGKAVMAIGAPGGPRIISGVLQVLYRVLGRGMDLDLAVQAPRVHHQFLPPKVLVDAHRFSPEVLKSLKSKGHTIEEDWMGRVYAVRLRPDGLLEGAFDARGEGAVGGF